MGSAEIRNNDLRQRRSRYEPEQQARGYAEKIAESTTHMRHETDEHLERLVRGRTAAVEARVQELARSNAELEQFAYVASHDLQEPLRSVANYLDLLQRDHAKQLDEAGRSYVHNAAAAAERMRKMIVAMLDFSRVGSWAQPFEPTNCRELVDEAVANLQEAINDSGAIIEYGELPTLDVDRFQIIQLLQNLISNGIKFRSDGQPPQILISAELDGANWIFSVKDNGIGVPEAFGQRIFGMFARLHAREQYDGTGIGLSICTRIVERHGGDIWVEHNTPGAGANFRFTIAVMPRSDHAVLHLAD